VLPTGQSIDRIDLSDGRKVNISIVDAANPVVFCEASALGLKGTELPQDIESRRDVCWVLEDIRSTAAEMIGIVPERKVATATSPGLPKVAFVAPAQAYRNSEGRHLSEEEHDLQGRLMSMQTAHRSYGGAAAICTAVAAQVSGTLVHSCRGDVSDDQELVRIAHPSGVMEARVKMTGTEDEPQVASARVGRTARRIMSGVAYVPASLVED
jgi:2-methylaconitate cis-trans-isomerase PrpF